MQPSPPNLGYWTYLIPLIVIGLVILRNGRARRLRIDTLWIAPVMILVFVGLAMAQEGAPGPGALAVDLVALAGGAALGWWRARFVHITVDAETHQLTSRATPVGMVMVLGIFALRYGIRVYAAQNAGALHVSVTTLTDAALVTSVGLVCAQRLAIALRASRLLTGARAAKE